MDSMTIIEHILRLLIWALLTVIVLLALEGCACSAHLDRVEYGKSLLIDDDLRVHDEL